MVLVSFEPRLPAPHQGTRSARRRPLVRPLWERKGESRISAYAYRHGISSIDRSLAESSGHSPDLTGRKPRHGPARPFRPPIGNAAPWIPTGLEVTAKSNKSSRHSSRRREAEDKSGFLNNSLAAIIFSPYYGHDRLFQGGEHTGFRKPEVNRRGDHEAAGWLGDNLFLSINFQANQILKKLLISTRCASTRTLPDTLTIEVTECTPFR